MLVEYLKYCITPCAPWAKRVGYLKESIGIDARATRQKKFWRPHLQKCHALIAECLDRAPHNPKILILGSGAGHDIPLSLIRQKQADLTLVDLVHPMRIRCLTLGMKRKLLHLDLTDLGLLLEEDGQKARIWSILDQPQTLLEDQWDHFDIVISLNVATQLPVTPVNWMCQHWGLTKREMKMVTAEIIQRHFDWLRQFSGIKCLITDKSYSVISGKTGAVKTYNLLEGVNDPLIQSSYHSEWDWDLAPKGELSNADMRVHHVKAWMGKNL